MSMARVRLARGTVKPLIMGTVFSLVLGGRRRTRTRGVRPVTPSGDYLSARLTSLRARYGLVISVLWCAVCHVTLHRLAAS